MGGGKRIESIIVVIGLACTSPPPPPPPFPPLPPLSTGWKRGGGGGGEEEMGLGLFAALTLALPACLPACVGLLVSPSSSTLHPSSGGFLTSRLGFRGRKERREGGGGERGKRAFSYFPPFYSFTWNTLVDFQEAKLEGERKRRSWGLEFTRAAHYVTNAPSSTPFLPCFPASLPPSKMKYCCNSLQNLPKGKGREERTEREEGPRGPAAGGKGKGYLPTE